MISNSVRQLFLAGLLLLAVTFSAQAATISYVGSAIDSPAAEWRTATTPKPLDGNGDNIYGSFAAVHWGIYGSYNAATINYGGSGSQYNQPGYAPIDRLDNPAIDWTAGIAITQHTFSIGTNPPPVLRVGVMEDVLAAGEAAGDHSLQVSLTLTTDPLVTASANTVAGNHLPDMYFFDIYDPQPGQAYQILATPLPGRPLAGYVGPITWDVAPLASVIDPDQTVWSVDLQGGPTSNGFADPVAWKMSGSEPNFGHGNIWNMANVKAYDGVSPVQPAPFALVDSNGNAGPVTFSIFGAVQGWTGDAGQGPSMLTRDYMFLSAGQSATQVPWEIAGLAPNTPYEFYVYGGRSDIGRTLSFGIDQLTLNTTVDAVGTLFNVRSSAEGKITGTAGDGLPGEENWTGFQLRAVPEPASYLLGLLGLLLIPIFRRR